MTAPTADSRSADRRERLLLADLIDGHRAEMVARWMAQVRVDLAASAQLEATQLRDAMPDYLRGLAIALRSGAPLMKSGDAAWVDVAREHALARVRLGFDVGQLVHEFIVLRRILTQTAAEQYGERLEESQAVRVAELIEAAIATAVHSYVEARDYEARKKEAEHVSFITHELRNPLSIVKLAASRARHARGAELQRVFDVLDRNVDKIASLIDGVLRVERLQAGKVEPHVREMPLAELLAQPLDNARMGALAKGLTLDVRFDPALLVRADPELAASAIGNVLDNAVKYTDVGTIRVHVEASGGRVRFHVRDNCGGLSKEELRIIFEPFERASSKKPGSGLGLAIARRALEVQGGDIEADSSGEQGCHFQLTLPRAFH